MIEQAFCREPDGRGRRYKPVGFFSGFPLWAVASVFVLAIALVAVAGVRLTAVAEKLADATGLGQAVIGAVAIGFATSLSGLIVAAYGAAIDRPEFAIATAMGGLPAQTAFLVIADIAYRRVNIEHASASVENLSQTALLFILLSIPLVAMASPDTTLLGVHPATPALFGVYLFGLRVIGDIQKNPMWEPRKTPETQTEEEVPETPGPGDSLRGLLVRFAILASLLAAAGFMIAQSGIAIMDRTGASGTVVGGLFTAIATSLPELITTLAAVRRKALNLAVGNIIGGNSFDVLFIAVADIFYRQGSLYHQINTDHVGIMATAMLMTGFLLLGLLRREKHGVSSIGFESAFVLAIYAGMVAFVVT